LTLNIGFFIAAFTQQKRGLHDYLSDTRVVYVRRIGTLRKSLVIFLGICLPLFVLLAVLAAVAIPKIISEMPPTTNSASATTSRP